MIPYSAMAYDQQSRWDTFARMLPYPGQRHVVLSRYVLGWLCTAVGGAAAACALSGNVLSLFSSRRCRLFSLWI